MELKLIDGSQLIQGDVLLCYSSILKDKNDQLENGYGSVKYFV